MSFWQLDGVGHLQCYEREEVEEVVSRMYAWRVCLKCCMRALAIKEAFLYKETHKELAKVLKVDLQEFVCVVCLQILQEKFCCDAFLQQIQQQVLEQNVQFEDFFCALSLPVSQLIREHLLCIRLHETFPKMFEWPDVKRHLTPLKDVWKWMNGAALARLLEAPFNQRGDFEVQVFFVYKDDDAECNGLNHLLGRDSSRRKGLNGFFNRMNMVQMLDEAPVEVFKVRAGKEGEKEEGGGGMGELKEGCELERVECVHQAIFVAGRYNKYSRELSQTPWVIQGVRKHESSVEEMVAGPIEALFQASSSKFSSSGREDVDVRMMGRGRPFVIELMLPKVVKATRQMMLAVQKEINKGQEVVKVRDLQVVRKVEVKEWMKGEEDKIKKYRALCVVRGGVVSEEVVERVNSLHAGLQLQQKTPVRVLHRRVLATRERTIHQMHISVVDRFGAGRRRRFEDLERYMQQQEEEAVIEGQDVPQKRDDGNSNKINSNNNYNNNNNGNNEDISYSKASIVEGSRPNSAKNEVTLESKGGGDAEVTLLLVELKTQAGTYIKEFVHGDFNRTTPNLGSLLAVECDILLLDVLDVEVNWPEPIDDNNT